MNQKNSSTTGGQKGLGTWTTPQVGVPGSEIASPTEPSSARVASMQAQELTTLIDLSKRCMKRQTELQIVPVEENGKTAYRRTAVLQVPEEQARQSLSRLKLLLTPATPKQVADLLALMAGIYPVTRKTADQAGAAAYWISIFQKQPIGAVLLGFDRWVLSEEDFMPSPGRLLAMVEPFQQEIVGKINMLESALTGRSVDKPLPETREERLHMKRLRQIAELRKDEIENMERAKAQESEPPKDWTPEEIEERRERMKTQINQQGD